MTNGSITIRLAPKDIEGIDRLIEEGYFTSRSDLIRASVRHYINEMANLPHVIQMMKEKADRKGIDKGKIIKAVRKARKQLYKEVYSDA